VTAAALAARCLDLLGPVPGPLVVAGPPGDALVAALAARAPVAGDGDRAAAGVCSFLGERADPGARAARLATLAARLPSGAPLVVVDHNQPRAPWRRLAAAVALALDGLPPSRARHPTAREARDAGFTIERLRFAAGERLQLVVARRGAGVRRAS
jgi:hypothetical protein